MKGTKNPASFRDPSGFIFIYKNKLFRQVNKAYKEHYEHLVDSGLYKRLEKENYLVSHKEVSINHALSDIAYKIIKPEPIEFISYPYEWCFSQFKDAALATLYIQKVAIEHEMSLKDSSAFNIQFSNGHPILIDTLSFEKYTEGKPWVAYRQFCQHFLAPLAIMGHVDIRLGQLLKSYVDGIPLDLASALLPSKSWLKFSLVSHLHAHSKTQKYFSNKQPDLKGTKFSKNSLLGIIDSLENAVKKLKFKITSTEWSNYYEDTNYSSAAMEHKENLVSSFIDQINPETVWDIGANVGYYSRVASKKNIFTIAFDSDPVAVEKNYLKCKKDKENKILPLLFDITNPSPNLGWANNERVDINKRGFADTVLALALLHHLTIGNNLPFSKISEYFKDICTNLIIEFVPKTDSQVVRLLSNREDIFENYDKKNFEHYFKKYFKIVSSVQIKDSKRTMYYMRRKLIGDD